MHTWLAPAALCPGLKGRECLAVVYIQLRIFSTLQVPVFAIVGGGAQTGGRTALRWRHHHRLEAVTSIFSRYTFAVYAAYSFCFISRLRFMFVLVSLLMLWSMRAFAFSVPPRLVIIYFLSCRLCLGGLVLASRSLR